jgi:O-antigen/teichoic acid export membrane protein
MNEQLAKLFRNAAVYGFGRILGKVISFLLIPFYTFYFSTAEYGVMEILNLAAMIAAVVLAPGLSTAVMRFYYDTESEDERKAVISTGLITTLLVGGAVTALAFLLPQWISQVLLGTSRYRLLIQLLAVGFFFTFSADIGWVYLRGRQRSTLYTFLTQAFLVSSVLLNLFFVAVLKLGVAGCFWANAAAGGAIWAILLFLTFRDVGLRFSARKLMSLLRFGAPLFTVWMAAFVLNYSDRFFLQRFWGIEVVGIYAVGYKFAYILSLLAIQPFQLMWEPQSYEISKRDDATGLFSRIFLLYAAGLISLAFFLSLGIREVFEIMVGARFSAGYVFVPLLAFAYAIQGMGLFFEAGLLIRKKNVTLSIIGIASTLVCLVLNLFLIRSFAAWGAVWATFLSFTFLSAASYSFSVRAYAFHCNLLKIVNLATCSTGLLFAAAVVPIQSLGLRIVFKLALSLIYLVVLWRQRLLPEGLMASLWADAAAWLRRRVSPVSDRMPGSAKGVN